MVATIFVTALIVGRQGVVVVACLTTKIKTTHKRLNKY